MKKKLSVMMLCAVLTLSFVLPAAASLRQGDRGETVLRLQQALSLQGFPVAHDGSFGRGTYAAVLAYQRARGLEPDGIAGRMTLGALELGSLLQNPLPQSPAQPQFPDPPAPSGRFELGSFGADVSALQRRLFALGYDCGRTDGVYDLTTRAAVIDFQTTNALAADGIAGHVTLGRLYGSPKPAGPKQETGQSPLPVPTSPPQAPVTASGSALVSTPNGGSLRLRKSAESRVDNVLGSLPNGTQLEVLGMMGDWTAVRHAGRDGFVQSRFLQPQAGAGGQPMEPPLPETTQEPQATLPPQLPGELPQGARGMARVYSSNGKSVNLRSSAENLGMRNYITQVKNGEEIQVLSSGSVWSRVNYRGAECYIMSAFLRFTQLEAVPTPSPEPSKAPTEAPTEVPGEENPAPEEEEIRFSRILRQNMEGPDVSAMQAKLESLRYAVTITGRYDTATVSAVRKFQSLHGLAVDGVFGGQSAQVLFGGAAREADSAPLTFQSLRMGSEDGAGSAVTLLQTALKGLGFSLTVDGSYGIKTHDAVVGFQQRNGLTVSGVADALTQNTLYSGSPRGADTPVLTIDPGIATGAGPSGSSVKLLDWYTQVKPQIASGQTAQVYHPESGITFDLKYYSLGRHADSEPMTLQDTQLMNRAFGEASWDTREVYVKMPNGDWTLASMHNYPHLYGSIADNGFGGHLCVHFKRDLEETQKADPNYGVQNQTTIRKAWLKLTGEQVM